MSTPLGNSITTAENAITLMLALAREIRRPTPPPGRQVGKEPLHGRRDHRQDAGRDRLRQYRSIVADRALGLRCNHRVRSVPVAGAWKDLGVEKVELDELSRRAEFITLDTPLTEKTRNIIDAAALAG